MSKRTGGMIVATEPAVAIPRSFFADLLPQITDIAELHVTLTFFRLLAENQGVDSPISERVIARERLLREALKVVGSSNEPSRRIATGLDLAVGRGALCRFVVGKSPNKQTWYYLNTPANQALVAAMSRGAIPPPAALWDGDVPPPVSPERPNVFRLYEQNIGLLTPLIADHLVSALESYPQEWIEDAINEAVSYNRRSWRYIQRILEQWSIQGRGESGGSTSHETHRRRDSRYLDPDQYRQGRHLKRTGGR
ncbi:MAG: DnaD domain-containing protein [Thermomicrobiales bacterium]